MLGPISINSVFISFYLSVQCKAVAQRKCLPACEACALKMMIQHGGRKQLKRRVLVIWFGLAILSVYIIITAFAAYKLIKTTDVHEAREDNWKERRENVDKQDLYREVKKFPPTVHEVEVWGKAAIGLYFWEHIIEGDLEKVNGELWSYGVRTIDNVRFKFRTGAGIAPQTVPITSQYVVLIINGRIAKKIEFAKMWLNSLYSLPNLKKVVVILLGNEQCNNNWLLPYMDKNGGFVNMAYIVYDIANQDDRTVMQWPLGVATYRNFPRISLSRTEISGLRAYVCNFLGTLYPGSSRETLRNIFNKHKLYSICYLRIREMWQPNESKETAEEYYQALLQSDLTLCPVGINTECYRIYEACSYGSVPVVEDVRTEGNCSTTPLQLLKNYNAPFIYVKSWNELPQILEKEELLSLRERVKRREKLLQWYQQFKEKLRRSFVVRLKETFFGYS